MRKILMKVDHWVFGTIGGKIVIGLLTIYGIVVTLGMVVGYNHALEIAKDARWKAEQAAEEWRGNPISRNVIFKDYRRVRGKGYVENLYEGKKTVEGVEWVRPTCPLIDEPDEMAVFSRYVKGRGSRKGYLNIYSGRVEIPDQFKHAWNFKNGEYAVACMDNDSLYVINRGGGVVCKRGFKLSNKINFGFVFNDDLCIMEENNGKFGIIDPEGNWILKPEYDWITRDPHTGSYKVMQSKQFGIMDKEMREVLPINYKDIRFKYHYNWNDPYKDDKWIDDVVYWAENEDGVTEYYDEQGKLLKTAIWEK